MSELIIKKRHTNFIVSDKYKVKFFLDYDYKGLYDKKYFEVPDIVSRNISFLSNAHKIASLRAIENAFQAKTTKQIELLRELLLNAEALQCLSYQIIFDILPQMKGGTNIFNINEQKEILDYFYTISDFNNDIIEVIGKRKTQSINLKPGGFYINPKNFELKVLLEKEQKITKLKNEIMEMVSKIKVPILNIPPKFLALQNLNYSFYQGAISTDTGKIENKDLHKFVAKINKSCYILGSLARFSLNKNYLFEDLKKNGEEIDQTNLFSILKIKEIEFNHLINRVIDILKQIEIKEEPKRSFLVRANTGIGIVETAYGTLIHEYKFDQKGDLKEFTIVDPIERNSSVLCSIISDYLKRNKNIPNKKKEQELKKIIYCFDV